MAIEEILTPEVIATIIGLIILVGGGTSTGILLALKSRLISIRNVLDSIIKAIDDGQITPAEIKDIIEKILVALGRAPGGSEILARATIQDPKAAKIVADAVNKQQGGGATPSK